MIAIPEFKTIFAACGSTYILNSAEGVILPRHKAAPPIKIISFILSFIEGSFLRLNAMFVSGPVGHK